MPYKVIDKKTKFGTNAGHYIKTYGYDDFEKIYERNPELFPKYEENTLIRAPYPDHGIFCFQNLHEAMFFISMMNDWDIYTIVGVVGIGQMPINIYLPAMAMKELSNLGTEMSLYYTRGVICCQPDVGVVMYEEVFVI
jgi:hypothetical protein